MPGKPAPLSRRELVPALVGRVAEALAGEPGAVLVLTAQAGAGKTHTLRAVAEELAGTVRTASGSTSTVLHPYAVLATLLDIEVPDSPSPELDAVLLARIDELTAGSPLVLVVDDAQLVDAASLAFLEQVAAASADLPIALLLGRRPTPERAQLTRLLARTGTVEIPLGPLDAMDLDVVVHEHTGRWPGPRLRDALLASDTPLQAITTLQDLVRDGQASGADVLELTAPMSPPIGVAERIGSRLTGLDGPPRELARALAVVGAATALPDLAGLMAVPAVSLVEPAQVLLDADLVTFTDDERLAFAHDSYREAVYDAIPAALRRLLHAAWAGRTSTVDRPQHLIAADAPVAETLAAVRDSAASLADVPAVQADALGASAAAWTGASASAELAAVRARALARSGQLRRAEEVARTALASATDPAVITELMRVRIFSLTTRGDIDGVLELIEATLALPVPDRTRQVLTEHRRYVGLLGGTGPVSLEPFAVDPREVTLNGLLAELLRCFLTGYPGAALEYAWDASRRQGSEGVDPNEGASADAWPPVVELQHNGPDAAAGALVEMIRLSEERGHGWISVTHQFSSAAIALAGGRLDDACAQFDAGLEQAAASEFGWVSQAVGTRALIDVQRGDNSAAAARLDAWDAAPGPLQLGIPQPARARIALLEAQRRYPAAAQLARTTWQQARGQNLRTWLVNVAPGLCRVAVRAADAALLAAIADGLAEVPQPLAPASVPAYALASALIGPTADLAATALRAAQDAAVIGDRTLELAALEEAAVATATWGDRDEARELARRTLELAESCGASGTAARIAGRLRAAGLRLGATAGRRRPQTGWDSLTPTEQLVADLVATGLNGPEIGRRLHVSPRTVQTHVSHALGKLGLTNRVELAAAMTTRAR